MTLSRQEAIAIIREAAKQFPEGHDTLKDVAFTLCTWAVLIDDAVMGLQRTVAELVERANR